MERLTKKHYKKNGGYYMKCSESCETEETACMECGKSDEIVDRLGQLEEILGDEYDLERLKAIVNQRMTMREEVAERFSITKDISVDRLQELVEADRDGRCIIVTRCCECKNHSDVDGEHYCKFWRMYCPDDSEFYCKAAKPQSR